MAIDDERRQMIVRAVLAVEPTQTEAWSDLDALSTQTIVDTIETFEAEITIEDDQDASFSGPLIWYVLLNYGPEGDDRLTTSESFPGQFHGRFEGATAVVDRITVDVSSFYQ